MSQIRARLLRDICLDMSFVGDAKWIETEALERMFDLRDRFEEEFSEILSDLTRPDRHPTEPQTAAHEIFTYYGQILSRISNFAANVVNQSLPIRDISHVPPERDDDGASKKGQFSEASAVSEQEWPKDGESEATQQPASELDHGEGGYPTPPPELVEVVVRRLPGLKSKVQPFLFTAALHQDRVGYTEAFRDILISVFWKLRDQKDHGGFWPSSLSDTEHRDLIEFRNDLSYRIESEFSSDDIGTLCALLTSTIYAEWSTAVSFYYPQFRALTEEIKKRTEIPTTQAVSIIGSYRNLTVLAIGSGADEIHKETAKSAISMSADIFALLLDKVTPDPTGGPTEFKKYFSGLFAFAATLASSEANEILARPLDLLLECLKQTKKFIQAIQITPELLKMILTCADSLAASVADASETELEITAASKDIICQLIDSRRFLGEGFRDPGYDDLEYTVYALIFRNLTPSLHLDDTRISALIDLFDRHVGYKARKLILENAQYTSIIRNPSAPIVPLADYFAKLRREKSAVPNLPEASLTIWGALLMSGEIDRVTQEVMAQLDDSGACPEAKDLEFVAIAYRGVILLGTGFLTPSSFLETFKERLLAQHLLGFQGAARLYRSAQGGAAVTTRVNDRDAALVDAIAHLARMHFLAGQDLGLWQDSFGISELGKTMSKQQATRVDQALAQALLDRLKGQTQKEAALKDLEQLRHLAARGQSEPVERALEFLVEWLDPESPEYAGLAAEMKGITRIEPSKAPVPLHASDEVDPPVVGIKPDDATVSFFVFKPLGSEGWPLPPLFGTGWRGLGDEALGAAARRARACFPATFKSRPIAALRAGRATELACYPDFTAVELLFSLEDGSEVTQIGVYGKARAMLINGSSAGIHELNAGGTGDARNKAPSPLDLTTPEKAAAYLSFFCAAIQAEFGPFNIISSVEQLTARWLGEALPEQIGAMIQPVSITPFEPDLPEDAAPQTGSDRINRPWRASAAVLYSDVLFNSELHIAPDGHVEMLSDDAKANELPVLRDGFLNNLRIVPVNRSKMN